MSSAGSLYTDIVSGELLAVHMIYIPFSFLKLTDFYCSSSVSVGVSIIGYFSTWIYSSLTSCS